MSKNNPGNSNTNTARIEWLQRRVQEEKTTMSELKEQLKKDEKVYRNALTEFTKTDQQLKVAHRINVVHIRNKEQTMQL